MIRFQGDDFRWVTEAHVELSIFEIYEAIFSEDRQTSSHFYIGTYSNTWKMRASKTLFEGEVKFMNIRDQLVIKATIKAGMRQTTIKHCGLAVFYVNGSVFFQIIL